MTFPVHLIDLKFLGAPSWSDPSSPPHLLYRARPYAPAPGRRIQPVIAGRTILEPLVDLNAYRCSAVIDWVELELTTPGRHQAVNIHRRARKILASMGSCSNLFVSGPAREAGYIGSLFILRLQDPRPSELRRFLSELVTVYAPGTQPEDIPIRGIEISVDFRVLRPDRFSSEMRDLLRWQMVDVLRRHLRPDPVLTEAEACTPRFFMRRGHTSHAQFFVDRYMTGHEDVGSELERLGLSKDLAVVFRLVNHRQLPVDTTSYIGGKDFPVQIRVMDKRTDRRDPSSKAVVDLDEYDYRARIEVSLPEAKDHSPAAFHLGLRTVKDLGSFEFQSVRRLFFEFFLPSLASEDEDGLGALPIPFAFSERDVFDRSGVYGLDRLHRALEIVNGRRWEMREIPRRPLRLGKKGHLVSYMELNQKVDRALRRLSRDWTAV